MKKLLAAVAVVSAIATPSWAATFTTDTYYATFGTTPTDFSNLAATFQLFDSQDGARTLTGITLGDTFGFTTTITVSNSGSRGSTGYATTTSLLGLSAANSSQDAVIQRLLNTGSAIYYAPDDDDFSNPLTFHYSTSGTSNQQNYTLAKGATQTLSPDGTASASSGPVMDSVASELAAFIASGTTSTGTILFSTLTNSDLHNTGGNTDASQRTSAQGAFSIAYTYVIPDSSVPEPATWAMMIAGFGLVGYGMRRRGTAVLFN